MLQLQGTILLQILLRKHTSQEFHRILQSATNNCYKTEKTIKRKNFFY